MVDAIVNLSQHSGAVGEIFNVGNDQPISILELAEKIKAMTHSSSELRFVPYDQAYEAGFEDMAIRVPDLSKIKTLVGYQPKVKLDEILKNVIEYFSTSNMKV